MTDFKKILSVYDFNSGTLNHKNLGAYRSTTAPSSPFNGLLWWDTTNSVLKVYKASTTSWITLGAGISSVVAGTNIDVDATDPSAPVVSVVINDAGTTDTDLWSADKIITYITSNVEGLFDLKGELDCSTNPNFPAAAKGDVYRVSVAGKAGGASGRTVEVGDLLIALADNAGGTEGAVGSSWTISQYNIDVAALAGSGLGYSGGALVVNVDDSSIEINSDTLRVKAGGITNDMLAGSIADTKLSTISTANKVFGSAVQLASGSAISNDSGLKVNVDESTLEVNSGSIRQKDGGTTYNKLAANAKATYISFADTDFNSDVLTIAQSTHGMGATDHLRVQAYSTDETSGFATEVSGAVLIEIETLTGDVKIRAVGGFNGFVAISK